MPAPINRVLIEVVDATTQTRSYDKSDGTSASYLVQTVYLHVPGKKYAKEFARRIQRDEGGHLMAPAAPGWYEQDYSDIWTNFSFNRCEFTLGKLVPVSESQVKAVLSSWQPQLQAQAA